MRDLLYEEREFYLLDCQLVDLLTCASGTSRAA